MHRTPLRITLLAAFAALSTLATVVPPASAQNADPVVVFLVRHAERAEDGTDDPPISRAGEERARLVARMLADAGLTRIHSTNYKRTIATARPTADALGLAIESYDPRDLQGFARALRSMSGRHLVVGHSNTTPQLVAALGGDPGPPIEEMEYDRLYMVTLLPGGGTSTVLLRFGAPYRGP